MLFDKFKNFELDVENKDYFLLENARLQTLYGLNLLKSSMEMYGGNPQVSLHLVLNIYDWYSITINKYVLLIAKVFNVDKKNYRNEVIPFCIMWRNKIAAHYSYSDPQGDNIAVQQASLCQGISFKGNCWVVGEGSYLVKDEDGTTHEAKFPEWNLLDEHKKIVSRYFE